MAAMMAGMANIYGMPNMFDTGPQYRTLTEPRRNALSRGVTDDEVERKYGRPFRRKREDETDEEYAAAWHEHRKQRLAEDCAKKGLTVYEINGELIPAKNEHEAQKRYKNRHK